MDQAIFDRHGILLRRSALRRGLDDNWLGRQRRAGAIVRMRHGAYVDAQVWETADRSQRHVLTSRAVLQQYDGRVALSHASAHLARGGPDWGLEFPRVNLTNLHGRGDRAQAGVTHHRGDVRVGDVTRFDGHWMTAPPRSAIETAAFASRNAAVCVLDWTLNQGLATPEQLDIYAHSVMVDWPDTSDLPRKVVLSNGKSESIGESLSRLMLEDAGFKEVVAQFKIFHPDGRLAGITDLWLPRHRVMIEFDGKIKYGRLLKPGQRIEDVIMAERSREKLLMELTGSWMFRIIWPELFRPEDTLRRLNHVIAQAARQRAG